METVTACISVFYSTYFKVVRNLEYIISHDKTIFLFHMRIIIIFFFKPPFDYQINFNRTIWEPKQF